MSLLGKLFGADEEQQRSDDLDARLRALNERDYGPGGQIYNKIQDEQGPAAAIVAYQDVEKHLDQQEAAGRDIAGQIDDAFGQALDDETSGIRKAVGGAIGSIFSVIPWQVWVLAAVGLFIYSGGWIWIKGRLAR